MRVPLPLRFLAALAVVASGVTALHAQTAFVFSAEQQPSCTPGATVDAAAGLMWNGFDCTEAAVAPGGESITLRFDDTYGVGDRVVQGYGTTPDADNVLPGSSDDFFDLTFGVTGDLGGIDASAFPAFAQFEVTTPVGYQAFLVPLGERPEGCAQLVRGGGSLTLSGIVLQVAADYDIAAGLNLAFTYTLTPSSGAIVTEIVVPDSDFDPTSGRYEYALPAGAVNFYPGNGGSYYVGLENNTPDAQEIRIEKSGGSLRVAGYAELDVQRAGSGEPHAVELALEDAELCLSGSEFGITEDNTLSLTRSAVHFSDRGDCIAVGFGGKLVVAGDEPVQLGYADRGMQLWDDDGHIEVAPGATVRFGGILLSSGSSNGPLPTLDIAEGARVVVEASAEADSGWGTSTAGVRVRVAPGGTFEYEAGVAQNVRDFFDVEGVVSAEGLMPATAYALSPNPAPRGQLFVRAGVDARAIASLEVVDAAGRTVAALTRPAVANVLAVPVAAAGVYAVRIRDVDGRLATLRGVVE